MPPFCVRTCCGRPEIAFGFWTAAERFKIKHCLKGPIQPVHARSLFRLPVTVVCVAILVGCAMKPPAGPSPARRATQLETAGKYRDAGDAWLAAASMSRGEKEAVARYNAAIDYQKANALGAAWEALAPVSVAALPVVRRMAGAQLKARLALATHRPQAALDALAAAPSSTNRQTREQILELEGRARFAVGDAAAGLAALVTRGQLFNTASDMLANDELLWGLLIGTPQLPKEKDLSATAQGWVSLAAIWRTAWEVPSEFSRRLNAWRIAHPDHPANRGLVAEIVAEERARLRYPSTIALLLPLSGPYASQAQAVEAGILSAYYRDNGSHPRLKVYDTDGTASGARDALNKAQADGSDFVLGPVTVGAVGGAASADPSVPVLALNYLSPNIAAPARFFQFGLSPEDEAQTAAQQAVSNGLARAVVLVPDNSWGQGIATAFTRALTEMGGRVLATATFRPKAEDFAGPMSKVFGLDASEAREQRLAAVLGQPLGFQPRRRQDVQFVFFAAPFSTARLLAPQIGYYQGLGLPVYSISNVYRPGSDHPDLTGVHFPVMPWFVEDSGPIAHVRQTVSALFPQNWSEYGPLYALGYDAWRLVPLLANTARPLTRPVRGMTGMLRMGSDNVIHRRGDWAGYVNGKLRAVDQAAQRPSNSATVAQPQPQAIPPS